MKTQLATYAVSQSNSQGRRYSESAPIERGEFQRDRDRIVHCSAFRRLEYKTQVFVNHEGDWFRTRLTHSLEVAQISRSIARSLQLNEDLAESIALSHDLGHTPFGHAGQDALNACMQSYGGFEHNIQSLRIVDKLEQHYANFPGLNLTFETRAGILKHCSLKNAQLLGDVGQRFLENKQPSIEAQITNLADEIAYNNHDIDDGVRSGLITLEQLREISIFQQHFNQVIGCYPTLTNPKTLMHETIRRMINTMVLDLIHELRKQIQQYQIVDYQDVINAPKLAKFSNQLVPQLQTLKQFLFKNLYRCYKVQRNNLKAKTIITQLFNVFMENTELLPDKHQHYAQIDKARAIADYIAGMTDRYAFREHRKLFSMRESSLD